MGAWRYITVDCVRVWRWYAQVGAPERVRAAVACVRAPGLAWLAPAIAALPLLPVASGYIPPAAAPPPALIAPLLIAPAAYAPFGLPAGAGGSVFRAPPAGADTNSVRGDTASAVPATLIAIESRGAAGAAPGAPAGSMAPLAPGAIDLAGPPALPAPTPDSPSQPVPEPASLFLLFAAVTAAAIARAVRNRSRNRP